MNIKQFILFLVIFLTSITHYAQNEVDKNVNEIEELIKLGYFSKAHKDNQKLLEKINNGESNDRHIAFIILRQAQIEAATGGNYDLFSTAIDSALTILKSEANSSTYYLKGLVKAIQIEFKGNQIKKAGDLLKTAQSVLKENPNNILQSRVDFLQSKYHFYTGEYREALALTRKNYEYFSKQVADQAKVLQINTLNMHAQILLEKGKYFEADSVLGISKPLIIRYQGEKSAEYVDFLFLKGVVADILEKRDESFAYLEEAYNKVQHYHMGYSNTVYTSDELYEYLAVTHWAMGHELLAEETLKKYVKNIKKFYKGYEYSSHELELLDVKKEIVYGEFNTAKQLLDSIFVPSLDKYKNPKLSAKVYELKYFSHLALGDLEEAEHALDTLITIESRLFPKECPTVQNLHMQKGIFYVEYKQELTKANAIYKNHYFKQLEHQLANSHVDNIYYKNVLANILEQKNALKAAEEVMKRVTKNVDSYYGEKYLITPEQHVNYAKLLIKVGKYDKAKKHLDLAIKIYNDNFPKAPEFAVALRYMARYYMTVHDYENAKISLDHAQHIFKKLSYADYESGDISEFAILYILQGEYHKVEDAVLSTISNIYEKYDSTSAKLIPEYDRLGELYLATGRFVDAEKVNDLALTLSKLHYTKNSLAYGESLLLKGKIYEVIGNERQGIEYLEDGVKILEKVLGNEHLSTGYAYQELAIAYDIYDKDKLHKKAQTYLENAEKIITKNLGKNNVAYARVLKNLAKHYINIKDYKKAYSYLEKSIIVWDILEKNAKNPEGTAEIYLLMAQITQKMGDTSKAISFYSKSITSYEKIFDDTHPKYLHAKSQMSKLYFSLGKDIEALEYMNQTTSAYLQYIDKYFSGLSEIEKLQFWQMIKTDFEFYYCLALKNRKYRPEALKNVYNFKLITKPLLLNSSLKVRKKILESNNPNLIADYKEWTEKEDLLIKQRHITSARRKREGNISKEILLQELNFLEKELQKNAFYRELVPEKKEKKTTWKTIKNNLKKGQYAVEIIRYRYYDNKFTDSVIYAALIIDPRSKKDIHTIILGNGNDMEGKYYKMYTNSFKNKTNDTISYSVYWEKIQKYTGNNQEVFVSLDGIYHQINLDALKIKGETYVLDKAQITLVSTSKDILSLQKKTNGISSEKGKKNKKKSTHIAKASKKATLVGNPKYYATGPTISQQSISNLPETEQEVDTISVQLKEKGWQVNKLVNEDADEESLKKINHTDIIHVATHGLFIPNKNNENVIQTLDVSYKTFLRSGLVLTDGGYVIDDITVNNGKKENGILTTYEVMNLSLEKTELVVLSACETGIEDTQISESIFGLQYAFLVAGAESVIMSLCKTPNEITAKLMNYFYANLLISNNKRDAFKQAKLALRKEYPQPYYWGSFVMIER